MKIRTCLQMLLALAACLPFAASAQSEENPLRESLRGAAPERAIEVRIGVRVDQVVNINQKSENYEVVGNLRMEWDEPRLAFDPASAGVSVMTLPRDQFVRLLQQKSAFLPAFSIQNQQGRRWSQTEGALVFANGHVVYGERFTVTLQAPEFNFTRYPFDEQQFFLHVESVYPARFVHYMPLDGFSRLGDKLGEEEWVFDKTWTSIAEVEGATGEPTARFSFGFEAHRHLNYYLLRLFVPLGIIIVVSWLTFFLQDFGKRVDLAGANLLIFVAFNFTISSDLPRLGYVTFMDAVMVATFVFSGLGVVVNVIFKRMEFLGHESLARRIDDFTIWIYPATLGVLIFVGWHWFLRAAG